MTYQLIKQDNHYIGVSDKPDVRTEFPYQVIERLTTGEYIMWQVDNTNDIDEKNQFKIICISSKQQAIDMDLFYFEVEGLNKEPKSIEIEYFIDDLQHDFYPMQPQHTTEGKLKRLTNFKINY